MNTTVLNRLPSVVANTSGGALDGPFLLSAPAKYHAEGPQDSEELVSPLATFEDDPNHPTIVVDMARVFEESENEDGMGLVEIIGPLSSQNMHSKQVESWLSGDHANGVKVATVQVPRHLLWKFLLFQLCGTLISRAENAMDVEEGAERAQIARLRKVLAIMP